SMQDPRTRTQRLIKSAVVIAAGSLVVPFVLIILGLGIPQTALAQPKPPVGAGAETGPAAIPAARRPIKPIGGGAAALRPPPSVASTTPTATATPSVSIVSITIACNTSTGQFHGVVTLSGPFTGSITLGLFYHVPGGTFTDSGDHTTVTFTGTSTATYTLAPF